MSQTKNILKVLFILFAIMLIFANISLVFASSYSDGSKTTYTPDEFTKTKDGKKLKEGGEIKTTGDGVDNVKATGGKIVGLVRVVGTIVAVGMLIVVGIKYMMGSAEERAEYKKTLFPYMVGAVLIFGASNLTQIIYTWASGL